MSSRYDSDLLALPFYSTHPYMLPFVGRDYESPKHKKLILVGESHYLPAKSTIHHNIDAWYAGTIEISETEQDWCNTRNSRQYGYGKFNDQIEKDILNFFPSGFAEIASFNYFLRPANETESFRNICTDIDREFAVKNFHNVLNILSPDLIVFASLYSFDFAEWKDYPKFFGEGLWEYAKRIGIEYIAVKHPSHGGWGKKVRGEKTSHEMFVEFIKDKWIL